MAENEKYHFCCSCMSRNNLRDLMAVHGENEESYAKMFETCFDLKTDECFRYICTQCAEKLEAASANKKRVLNSMALLSGIKIEEYLDESTLEEQSDEDIISSQEPEDSDAVSNEQTIEAQMSMQQPSIEESHQHNLTVHKLGSPMCRLVQSCPHCGICLKNLDDHINRCHNLKIEKESRQYPCHFCENQYNSRKACFTHLRIKHGLKLCTDQSIRSEPQERKKCHICNRDFSQKQILNKHLLKAHGFEVEKRKAFICPLCDERISYGAHFSAHLLHTHKVREQVEQLEFSDMDDFMLFKSAKQEETKYRFRKTTASKQTIEGIRSHYMCSHSGVYVYQGKGKRPAPRRQIYKTGKACPAHMIVTETLDKVLVTFYKTHVGHGPCEEGLRQANTE